MENELDWERLGAAVQARRTRLRLRQEDIAAAGGPSHATLRRLERGAPLQGRTLERLEQVLNWKVGVIQAILDGTAGDDPDAWVSDTARATEAMQEASMHIGNAMRGQFRTATDTAEASDSIASVTPINDAQDHVAHPGIDSAKVQEFFNRDATMRAGLDFIKLVDEHYGTDLESAAVRQAVLTYLRHLVHGGT
jgi:transcriptional regulator with XRE-family HTH domain